MRWRVTHAIKAGAAVVRPLKQYPGLNMTLRYDGDTLKAVEHELQVDESFGHADVVRKSHELLVTFWELLHYLRGLPISIERSSAVPLESSVANKSTGAVVAVFDALICHRMEMPREDILLDPPGRLLVWLRLANDARAGRDVDAIRNYYMIWEDMHGRPQEGKSPRAALELKHSRDFVSHGRVDNKEVQKFLKQELGRSITQFDPTDRAQAALVEKLRHQARDLVEDELAKVLQRGPQ